MVWLTNGAVTGPLGNLMSETLFTNARIFDGSGRPSFPGQDNANLRVVMKDGRLHQHETA